MARPADDEQPKPQQPEALAAALSKAAEARRENEQLMQVLINIDKEIVTLLRTAAQTIARLASGPSTADDSSPPSPPGSAIPSAPPSPDSPSTPTSPERSAPVPFAQKHFDYVSTVNKIQHALRTIIRILAQNGVLAAAAATSSTADTTTTLKANVVPHGGVPYNVSLAGEEKDLELAANRVELLLQVVRSAGVELDRLGIRRRREEGMEENVVVDMDESGSDMPMETSDCIRAYSVNSDAALPSNLGWGPLGKS
ncbi:uncharacterized protein EV422DRAFT_505312 [Fimicolochytrium jonesii]|uniref:uncharacterized protein n=1 Tax=Fimicolochytrium jonesii TaxID=1396493 RepID=UPI0022FDD80A|nr:uncharacterized protein EV422DRAFT_505312 [Fimicolochytrium jonesii]KAI8822482.1 hypothetical protein EV422DRAFT_505312 [Fimicolochytrium jonesii]